jgi:hypothetical protein
MSLCAAIIFKATVQIVLEEKKMMLSWNSWIILQYVVLSVVVQ